MTELERTRLRLSKKTTAARKSQLGQFFTPAATASFMASLLPRPAGDCRLLDAGAGIGSLSAALLDRWRSDGVRLDRVHIDAYELDASIHAELGCTLAAFAELGLSSRVHGDDFVVRATEALAGGLFARELPLYTHAILNPPYKKIASDSLHRRALSSVGIETVNLYSAFVALAVALAAPGGQIVAIVPRSFCNGPYYRPFRNFLFERVAIHRIHLFSSRTSAFKDDAVLQENVILHLERGAQQRSVTISTSTDDSFSDIESRVFPFDRIVFPDDPERFIHVPTSATGDALELSPNVRHSLASVGIQISTGPVVDFRLREHLRAMPSDDTVPLLYPGHFTREGTRWPLPEAKKPNAIVRNAVTEKWLYPSGFYCVVRRFSSKEESRRIVASVVDPRDFKGAPMLGFENHLNVFHEKKRGLPQELAFGLAAFLNTTAVDEAFRRFNGHTQVNATDLTLIKYPCREDLMRLGEWAMRQDVLTQLMIDQEFEHMAAA